MVLSQRFSGQGLVLFGDIMSQVLRVTLSKKATVKLDYHFPGFSCVQVSRAHWKSSLPLEKQLGLFLVLGDGDQFMLTEFGPGSGTEGVKVLDTKSYNSFSLKLAVINENETTEVEHKEESSKDSDTQMNDLCVSVLCNGNNSVISEECANMKNITCIHSFRFDLDSSQHSFTLDSSFKETDTLFLSEAYLVPTNSGMNIQRKEVSLNLLKDDCEFTLARFHYPQNNQRTKLDLFLPSASFKVLQRPSVGDDLSVDHEMEKNNDSGSNNTGSSNVPALELKLLLHVVVSSQSFQKYFSNYFILYQNSSLHINFSDQIYQQLESLTFTGVYLMTSKEAKCDRAVLIVKFGKGAQMTLDDFRGDFLSHRINETLSGSFSLFLALFSKNAEMESFESGQVIAFLAYTANYKQHLKKSSASHSETVDICPSCANVDLMLRDFNKIRDKFRHDVAYMRENNLFGCDTLLIGDSILRSVEPSLLCENVYVQSLGGCTIEQLDYILSVLNLHKLKRLIVHIGVNNTHGYNNVCNVSEEAAKYRHLLETCKSRAPNAKIFLSGVVARFDKTYCTQWVTHLNRALLKIVEENPELTFINNFSVAYDMYGSKITSHLAHDNLHISSEGTLALLRNINYVTKISDQSSLQITQKPYVTAGVCPQNVGDTTPLVDQFPFKQTYFYQNGAASTATAEKSAAFNEQFSQSGKKKKKHLGTRESATSNGVNCSNRSSFSTFSALSSSVEDFLSGFEALEDDKKSASKAEVENPNSSVESESSKDAAGSYTSNKGENSICINPNETNESYSEKTVNTVSSKTFALSNAGVVETSISQDSILDASFSTACSVENSKVPKKSSLVLPNAVRKKMSEIGKSKWNCRQPHNDANG